MAVVLGTPLSSTGPHQEQHAVMQAEQDGDSSDDCWTTSESLLPYLPSAAAAGLGGKGKGRGDKKAGRKAAAAAKAAAGPAAAVSSSVRPGASEPNRFYMYGVVGRLAMLAGSYELESTDPLADDGE